MLRGKDVEEINELKREGLSIRAISRLTGYDRKTIGKYLLKPTGRPVYGPRPASVSKLEPFKPYLNCAIEIMSSIFSLFLPKDLGGFERDRGVGMAGYHARCKIGGRTIGVNARGVQKLIG